MISLTMSGPIPHSRSAALMWCSQRPAAGAVMGKG